MVTDTFGAVVNKAVTYTLGHMEFGRPVYSFHLEIYLVVGLLVEGTYMSIFINMPEEFSNVMISVFISIKNVLEFQLSSLDMVTF